MQTCGFDRQAPTIANIVAEVRVRRCILDGYRDDTDFRRELVLLTSLYRDDTDFRRELSVTKSTEGTLRVVLCLFYCVKRF
jgi:hypothetical protein